MRNVSGKKSCTEKQNKHFKFNKIFFNLALYEIMWQNIIQPGRLHMTIWRVRIACWIPNATNTHPECEILFLVHCNSVCMQASPFLVICT